MNRVLRVSTGLDWSGDAGFVTRSDQNPYLVFVGCHASMVAEQLVLTRLTSLRHELGFRPLHVFKHVGTRDEFRHAFMDAISSIDLEFTAVSVDKSNWRPADARHFSGPSILMSGIGVMIEHMPDHCVSRQRLLVDMTRGEPGFIRDLKLTSRRVNRLLGRPDFGKIAARPDHRSDAQLIQVADMVSGHIRRSLFIGNDIGIANLRLIDK